MRSERSSSRSVAAGAAAAAGGATGGHGGHGGSGARGSGARGSGARGSGAHGSGARGSGAHGSGAHGSGARGGDANDGLSAAARIARDLERERFGLGRSAEDGADLWAAAGRHVRVFVHEAGTFVPALQVEVEGERREVYAYVCDALGTPTADHRTTASM